jgi:hypothetical protein
VYDTVFVVRLFWVLKAVAISRYYICLRNRSAPPLFADFFS